MSSQRSFSRQFLRYPAKKSSRIFYSFWANWTIPYQYIWNVDIWEHSQLFLKDFHQKFLQAFGRTSTKTFAGVHLGVPSAIAPGDPFEVFSGVPRAIWFKNSSGWFKFLFGKSKGSLQIYVSHHSEKYSRSFAGVSIECNFSRISSTNWSIISGGVHARNPQEIYSLPLRISQIVCLGILQSGSFFGNRFRSSTRFMA